MKLKTNVTEQSSAGTEMSGIAIPARHQLDAVEAPKQSGVGAMIALVCSLASLAMLGTVAALMYMNWELIQNV